jgi:hypothetical protein
VCAYRGTQPRHSPALSVRAAAGEMVFAASRRDLHGTIASVGSEATGLAPPSRSLRAWEASRCASLGTASPMSFATNLHHQAAECVGCRFWRAWRRQKSKSDLLRISTKPSRRRRGTRGGASYKSFEGPPTAWVLMQGFFSVRRKIDGLRPVFRPIGTSAAPPSIFRRSETGIVSGC